MLDEEIVFTASFFLKRIWNAFTKKTIMNLIKLKQKTQAKEKRGMQMY